MDEHADPTESDEYKLAVARQRLHILEGVTRALENVDAVESVVASCDTRADAVRRLMAGPWSMSEAQAHHALDLRIAQRTRAARADLADELRATQQLVAKLEAR